jgi:hypothetical protein
MLQYSSTSHPPPWRSRCLLQKLLRLINLRSQVRAPPPIGMIQHHKRTVVLPDPLLRKVALAISSISIRTHT